MTVYPNPLNEDNNGAVTSAKHADRGDGVSDWHLYTRLADGADAATGAKADAAVTNPATSGSVVALLKGLLTLSAPTVADTNVTTTAYAASLVISATSKRLYGMQGYNSSGATIFVQLHDAATLPADGAVPKIVIAVPSAANFSLDLAARGRLFTTGIVACVSSTGPTKTIGAAVMFLDAQIGAA